MIISTGSPVVSVPILWLRYDDQNYPLRTLIQKNTDYFYRRQYL